MKSLIIDFKVGMIVFFCFMACMPEADYSNDIISEDYVDGVFFVEHDDDGFEVKIETNGLAVFSPHNDRSTFILDESGFAQLDFQQGLYWIEYYWKDNPNVVKTLPVLVTKNTDKAKVTISSLKKMKSESKGFALVLRHVDARLGDDQVDSPIVEWWKSCDPEMARQMDDEGRANALIIGKGIKNLEIPIGIAISSEFCRAVQTIESMEIGVDIQVDPRLNHENANTTEPIFEDVFEIIRENETEGIQLLVGHYNMMSSNPHREYFRPFNMSDGFLMKKRTDGELEFIGSVPHYYWGLFE